MYMRSIVAALAAAGVGLVPAVAGSCGGGGDPFCGDGEHNPELGEQCDDGNDIDDDNCHNNCTANLPGATTIQWSFNKDAAPMFTNDSCTDLAVIQVEVTVTGPATATLRESCNFRQVVFQNLPAGMYTIEVKPLDLNEQLLIDAPVEITTNLAAGSMVSIDVPPDRWLRNYTGTFYFRTVWGGQDCASAVPPVVQHRLTMTQGGTPLTITTENGDPLDGSAPGTCVPGSDEFPQSVFTVPFGLATFTIEGLDSGGTPQFRETFETFVGAGVSNPDMTFDVNSLTPDAGVPDAGSDGDAG